MYPLRFDRCWRQRHRMTCGLVRQFQQMNQRLMTSESKRIVFRRFYVQKSSYTRCESTTAWDLSPQDNRFAAEIIGVEERVHNCRHIVPPDRVAHKNHIIAVQGFDLCTDRGARSIVDFIFGKAGPGDRLEELQKRFAAYLRGWRREIGTVTR